MRKRWLQHQLLFQKRKWNNLTKIGLQKFAFNREKSEAQKILRAILPTATDLKMKSDRWLYKVDNSFISCAVYHAK